MQPILVIIEFAFGIKYLVTGVTRIAESVWIVQSLHVVPRAGFTWVGKLTKRAVESAFGFSQKLE